MRLFDTFLSRPKWPDIFVSSPQLHFFVLRKQHVASCRSEKRAGCFFMANYFHQNKSLSKHPLRLGLL